MSRGARRLVEERYDWSKLAARLGAWMQSGVPGVAFLIGDADGIYHPGLFNDRLVLGLKGTMSEAELHVLRARLEGGIRNKAARGELRRGLPVGFIWGEAEGEVLFHPDEAVTHTIRTVFDRSLRQSEADCREPAIDCIDALSVVRGHAESLDGLPESQECAFLTRICHSILKGSEAADGPLVQFIPRP